MSVAAYLKNVFDRKQRRTVINKAVEVLKEAKKELQFDAIAFRGLSGAIVAPEIADALDVDIIAVRKPDNSHSYNSVEHNDYPSKYIIVDDLIDTGSTIKAIVKEIKIRMWTTPQLVGIYLYNSTFVDDNRKKEVEQEFNTRIL